MYPRGRGNYRYSFDRGRGRGNERVLGQIAHKRLIAANIASTSSNTGSNETEDLLYKEFLAYKAAKEDDNKASYVNIIPEGSEDGGYEQTPYKEIIMLLDFKYLKWKEQPWILI